MPSRVDRHDVAVRRSVVADRVPTIAGTPSSRLTIAAWQVLPPASVTSAAARRIVGTQSGDVIAATSTSPSTSRSPSFGEVRTRTAPDAAGYRPRARAGAARRDVGPSSASVVIGRDCTMNSSSPRYAHSMSWGAP